MPAPLSVETFRTAFPEFKAAVYPDATITDWLETAELLVNRLRFGRLGDQAVLNVAAHYLATAQAAKAAADASGSAGGIPSGAVTSKSVGGASIGYDASIGSVEGSGIYNATVYGRRFATWTRMFGAGGVQL